MPTRWRARARRRHTHPSTRAGAAMRIACAMASEPECFRRRRSVLEWPSRLLCFLRSLRIVSGFLLLRRRRFVRGSDNLAGAGIDVHFVDASLARSLDDVRVDELSVLALQLDSF